MSAVAAQSSPKPIGTGSDAVAVLPLPPVEALHVIPAAGDGLETPECASNGSSPRPGSLNSPGFLPSSSATPDQARSRSISPAVAQKPKLQARSMPLPPMGISLVHESSHGPALKPKWSVGRLRDWMGRSRSPPLATPVALRPQGLPPKTEKEAREHQQKFQELCRDQERMARKRNEAEARQRKQQQIREEFLQHAKDVWLTEIIPDWELQSKTRRARKLWLKGLPAAVRRHVWPLAIENGLKITPELFEILKAKAIEARKSRPPMSPISSSTASEAAEEDAASNADDVGPLSAGSSPVMSPREEPDALRVLSRNSSSDGEPPSEDLETCHSPEFAGSLDLPSPSGHTERRVSAAESSASSARLQHHGAQQAGEALSKESTAGLIQLDLKRTFPHLAFYREGEDHDNLYMVLDAYVHYRPDVGYVQGMTYLAALLLLYLDVYHAFVCLVNMLSKYHFLSFFRMDLKEMNVHLLTFELLLRELLPPVYEAFRQHDLRPEFYCIDWFVTLYSKSLPLDVAARVWDLFFMDPDHLYKVGIGILKHYVRHFTNADFDDMLQFLTHLPKKMNEEDFFEVVASLDVPRGRMQAIKQEAKRNARARIG